MDRYNWGVDGKGSCHICTYDDPAVLFCGLHGVPGVLVLDAYINEQPVKAEQQPES